MHLQILAEERTTQNTIDYLVRGVQRIIPVPIDLSVVGERFNLGGTWLPDLTPIAEKFAPEGLDEYLMILIHSNAGYRGSSGQFSPLSVGGYSTDYFQYDGVCHTDDRVIIVGGENSPNEALVKLASHEIGHALQGHQPTWDISKIHCGNYVDSKRCIMNTTEGEPKLTREFVEELYSGFCLSCTDSINSNQP